MTTNAERHRRTKTRITSEQHGDAPVWCDYTVEGRPCIVEAISAVAKALEQNDEDTSPEAVHAECLFYATEPIALPIDAYDLATKILEGLADHLYDKMCTVSDEWSYTIGQRDALARALAPAMDYLCTLDLGHKPANIAIDVSLDFVREVLGQEAKP